MGGSVEALGSGPSGGDYLPFRAFGVYVAPVAGVPFQVMAFGAFVYGFLLSLWLLVFFFKRPFQGFRVQGLGFPKGFRPFSDCRVFFCLFVPSFEDVSLLESLCLVSSRVRSC